MQRVSKTLHCLCTFDNIFSTSADVHQWLTFSRANMLQEFISNLQRGSLEIAARIWHRHQYEFMSEVDEGCARRILGRIPFSIPSEKLCSWLPKHLLKDLIKLCPSAIEVIARWADDKIKDFEVHEKANWPTNGHRFATMVIHAIENVAEDFYTGGDIDVQLALHVAQGKAHSPTSCLYHLRQTVLALTDLEMLAKKFFVKVKFSEYTQDDKTLVIFALLNWLMSGDDVEPLIRDFVNAFVLRHGLKLDPILEAYVTESLAASDCTWWVHEEAPWEDKLYAVVNVISDVQVKVQCIVECVRMAPVPWSKLTRDMCAFGMTCTTPFVKDLEEQERLAKLKIVLRRHSLHLIQYQNERNSQLILRSIVSHDGDSIMEDALMVVSALPSMTPVDAYYFRTLHLIRTERFDEAKDLLSSLEKIQKSVACKRIVCYVAQQLEMRPINKKCKKSLKTLTSGILTLHSILEANLHTQLSKQQNILSKIQRPNVLQVKYDLFPTLDEFDNDESCYALLKSFIIDLYAQCRQKASKHVTTMNRTGVGSQSIAAHCVTAHGVASQSVAAHGVSAYGIASQSVLRASKYLELTSCGSLQKDAEEGEEGDHSLWGHLNEVEHLSTLLGISRRKLMALLATLANQQGQYDSALQATRQLTVTRENETSNVSVNEVIFQLLRMTVIECRDKTKDASAAAQSRHNVAHRLKEFMDVVGQLISSALVSCHPCDVPMLNDFGHWFHTSKSLYEECHFKGVYCNDDGSSGSPYDSWMFSPVFADSSMPIEEPIVSRTFSTILNSVLESNAFRAGENPMMRAPINYDAILFEDEDAAKALVELTRHLQERNQDLMHLVVSQYAATSANLSAITQGSENSENSENIAKTSAKSQRCENSENFAHVVRSEGTSGHGAKSEGTSGHGVKSEGTSETRTKSEETSGHDAKAERTSLPRLREALMSDHVLTLLMKVINSKQRDFAFACSLLTNLKPKEALKVLTVVSKRLGYDYAELKMVAEIGQDFCNLNGLKDIKNQFNVLYKRASWGIRLEGFGISFKAGFSGDTKILNAILKELTSHSECSFSILNDFCTDFNWSLGEALTCYLRSSIKNWKPPNDKHEPCAMSKEATTQISRKLGAIIAKMKLNEAVVVVEDEFSSMSSYNYEMLDILLTSLGSFEVDDISEIVRGRNILQFLKVYTREEKPGEVETDEWLSTHSDSMALPAISQYRLPFHILYSKAKMMNKIVEKELNSSTVEKWICIAHDLKLRSDQIYFMATQNIVLQALHKEVKGNSWQVFSTNGNILTHTQMLISKIQHPELLTACANWIVNRLPPGADKVEAARMCVELARNCYAKASRNPAEGANVYKKFENRYQQLAIENSLHKFDLAHPRYLSLMKDPISLVFSLYEHPSLSSLATLNAEHQIDINGCVTEICQIMNFNQNVILLDILSKWLPSTDAATPNEVDETISNFRLLLDAKSSTEDSGNLSDAPLSRIIYVLRCYPQEQAVSYLINQAMSTSDSVGTGIKLKSLRCLLAIADQETIQKQTVRSIADIRKLLQTLTYVHRLEALGHAVTPTNFASMDKDAMVEGIWRAQRHNPDALVLLADICHDFKIPTASLWEALLGQLTKFVDVGRLDVTALEKVLVRIRNVPHLWLLPQVAAAWKVVVYSPFKRAHPPISKERLQDCVHSTNLLVQSCPVDIALEPLIALCNKLKLPVIALTVASKAQTRESDIQSIIEAHSLKDLKEQYVEVKDLLALPQNVEDILSNLM